MRRALLALVALVFVGCSSSAARPDLGLQRPLQTLSNPRVVRYSNERWVLLDATDGATVVVLGASLERPGTLAPVSVGQEQRLPTAVPRYRQSGFQVGTPAHLVDEEGEKDDVLTAEILATWNLAEVTAPGNFSNCWRLDVHVAPAMPRFVSENGFAEITDDHGFTVEDSNPAELPTAKSVAKVVGETLEYGGVVLLAIPLVALAIALSPILIPILVIVDPKFGFGAPSCGRPFRVKGRMRMACVAEGGEWIAPVAPSVELCDEDRAELARSWLLEARFEHASIAAFSALSLDLIALGAPPRLVERAHRAALDEIVHARLCFALASAYAGRAIGPGAFVEARARERGGSERKEIERLAVESLRDGCLNEGFAAALAGGALPDTKDEAVRATLAVIARDEARHVELAWSVLEWCLSRGAGDAVARLLRSGMPERPSAESAVPDRATLVAHGRLGRARLEALFSRVRAQVMERAEGLLPPRVRAPRREETLAVY